MTTPDQKKLPTLEDLLRLKRAERPSPEFWTQFESELRAKQLAAIMEKRPWWAPYARIFAGLARHPIPIGATAALAFAFAGYHGYQIVRVHHVPAPAPSAIELAQTSEPASAGAETSSAEPADATEIDAPPVPARPAAILVAVRDPEATPIRDATAVRVRNEWPSADWSVGSVDSPSARSIAVNLAAAQAAEPDVLHNLLGFSRSLDAGLVPERRSVTEPLMRMISPSAERRSRLLADALPAVATANETAMPSSEHFVSRLSDDRLYESISRYASGDSGNFAIKVKF